MLILYWTWLFILCTAGSMSQGETFAYLSSVDAAWLSVVTSKPRALERVRDPTAWLNDDVIHAMGVIFAIVFQCLITPPWTYQSQIVDYAARNVGWKDRKLTSSYAPCTPAFAIVATERDGQHWVVLGALPEHKQLVYYDSMQPQVEEAPSSRHMGRWLEWLHAQHPQIGFDAAASKAASKSCSQVVQPSAAAEGEGWKWWPHAQLPEQFDGVHCAVFALCFVQCLASGSPHLYSSAKMPALRKELARALVTCRLMNIA